MKNKWVKPKEFGKEEQHLLTMFPRQRELKFHHSLLYQRGR